MSHSTVGILAALVIITTLFSLYWCGMHALYKIAQNLNVFILCNLVRHVVQKSEGHTTP